MRRVLPTPRQASRLRAMEQKLRARREALRRRTAGQKPRRRWWVLLLLLLLLLLLWVLCCGPAEIPEPVLVDPPQATGVADAPLVVPPAPALPTDRVARRARPAFDSEPPRPLPWIASFRMQVSARSPRLAACFVGAHQPGRLKWTASVEPTDGHVSDHTLEPTLQSEVLSQEQRACVIGVLSDPPYRLEAGDGRTTPSRVAMVIEF